MFKVIVEFKESIKSAPRKLTWFQKYVLQMKEQVMMPTMNKVSFNATGLLDAVNKLKVMGIDYNSITSMIMG